MDKRDNNKNRLSFLRERSRLTQKEVGKILDLDITTISRHESGDRGLSPEHIKAYAGLYKVQTHEIFVDPEELSG